MKLPFCRRMASQDGLEGKMLRADQEANHTGALWPPLSQLECADGVARCDELHESINPGVRPGQQSSWHMAVRMVSANGTVSS